MEPVGQQGPLAETGELFAATMTEVTASLKALTLMRTTSADKFVDFVQNLDIDSRLNRINVIHPSSSSQMVGRDGLSQGSRITTPDRTSDTEFDQRDRGSSFVISEGDLLQPERLHNRIVFMKELFF